MPLVNILYLDSYTTSGGDSEASDEVGYGISASGAIKSELQARGFNVHDLYSLGVQASSKLEWIHESYRILSKAAIDQYQVIFIFHIFHQFPSEVRRILFSRGIRRVKIVGYTHGSHWDPSDAYRERFFPGMKTVDLANLLSLDRIFVVSQYFRRHLLKQVRSFSAAAANELKYRLVVTGLPINYSELERFRINTKPARVRVLFNHSPTPEKAPDIFFRTMRKLLIDEDIDVLVTRRFGEHHVGYRELCDLHKHFGARIQLGNTMSLDEYYSALWASHIQVSTARHESLGIATLEAMYAKNCCLLPNRQCYREISGGYGLYSSKMDLLHFLRKYIHDSDARMRMAVRLHSRSLRYLPKVIVRRISNEITSCAYSAFP
jgi:hypothetical protein